MRPATESGSHSSLASTREGQRSTSNAEVQQYVALRGANFVHVARPIEWTAEGVIVLDQRLLPGEELRHTYTDYREVARAIREMATRGAPAMGWPLPWAWPSGCFAHGLRRSKLYSENLRRSAR